jgi:transcriptional regulator with XRE-family HTH domain
LLYNQETKYKRGKIFVSAIYYLEGKNIIGDRVREARIRYKPKVTQVELISRLQVRGLEMDETSISKIENKTRSVTDRELVAIADSLNVSINWLLGKE